jgi:hypothetical protein
LPFADYSTTPSSNSTIGGVNIAENCPPGNLNNALRILMADAKAYSLSAPDISSRMPVSGGAFTGAITLSGAGAYRYNASASLASGATHFLPAGSARPAPAEGVVVFFY